MQERPEILAAMYNPEMRLLTFPVVLCFFISETLQSTLFKVEINSSPHVGVFNSKKVKILLFLKDRYAMIKSTHRTSIC